MSTAFLGAAKNLQDEKLEQAFSAMCEISPDLPQRKLAILKLITKSQTLPETTSPAVRSKA